MFKTAFTCALLALASAQDVQNLINQASAAVAPALDQVSSLVQSDNSNALTVNNYEWVLTEQGEFSITEVDNNANNLAPTLAVLLANVGSVAQQNSEAIGDILNAEAASLGVNVEGVNTAAVANQVGSQISESAGSIADAINNNYQQGAAALAQSPDLANQVNQQLSQAVQNQEAVSSAVNSALQSAGAVNVGDLSNVNGNNLTPLANQAADAANNAAGGADVSNLQELANQAIAAGSNAVSSSSQAASSAAQSASSSASSGINAAVDALSSSGINNVNDAANLVGAGNQ